MKKTIACIVGALAVAEAQYTLQLSEEDQNVAHQQLQDHIAKLSLSDYIQTHHEYANSEYANGHPMLTLDLRMPGALAKLENEGLTLKPGQTIEIFVNENPSTGYSWQIDKAGFHHYCSCNEHYYAPVTHGSTPVVGAPGVKAVTITAGYYKGTMHFRAVYARPWLFHGWDNYDEHSVAPGMKMNFVVRVDSPYVFHGLQ